MEQDGDNFLLFFVRKFVFGEKIAFQHNPLCYRFLVGSSLIGNLLKKKQTLRDTQGDYFSGHNRFLGKKAEDYAKQAYEDEIIPGKFFMKSQDFPFICSAPDFLMQTEDKEIQLLEIKSGGDKREAQQNFGCQRTLMQVLSSLEVFNLDKAVLYGVERNDEKDFCKYHDHKEIQRENIFFKNRRKIIAGYVAYLQVFFKEIYDIEMTEELKKALLELIDSRVPKRAVKRPPPTLELLRKQTLTDRKQKKRRMCPKPSNMSAPHGLGYHIYIAQEPKK